MPHLIFTRLLPVALVVVVAGALQASGWTCTVLDSSSSSSFALAASEGRVYGGLGVRATSWDTTTGAPTDHHPSGAIISSDIRGVGGGKFVGRFREGVQEHAIVWHELSGSGSDLHPPSYTDSIAYATDGVQQVGRASRPGAQHAALWTGNGESFVNLNPSGATHSTAHGVYQGIQVGQVGGYAGFWQGTAASWQALSTSPSGANGIYGDQVVGFISSGTSRAMTWSVSTGSSSSLHPASMASSIALGVSGGVQVGAAYAVAGFRPTAALWQGTAESFVDLHQFAPSEYLGSVANSVFRTQSEILVAGYGTDSSGRQRALMWTQAVPEPGTVSLLAVGVAALVRMRRRSA